MHMHNYLFLLQDLEMSLVKNVSDKAMSDVLAGEEDDEAAILVRNKSISVAREASKLPSQPVSDPDPAGTSQQRVEENPSHPLEEGDKENSQTKEDPSATGETTAIPNSRIRKTDLPRPSRISQQEAFSKDRKPRKSVLKHTKTPILRNNSTFDSTTAYSPASSPSVESDGSADDRSAARGAAVTRSHVQEERKCCVVM